MASSLTGVRHRVATPSVRGKTVAAIVRHRGPSGPPVLIRPAALLQSPAQCRHHLDDWHAAGIDGRHGVWLVYTPQPSAGWQPEIVAPGGCVRIS